MTGFSFGFSGDDIDVDADDTQVNDIKGTGAQETNTPTLPEPVKAQRHEMDEWVCFECGSTPNASRDANHHTALYAPISNVIQQVHH